MIFLTLALAGSWGPPPPHPTVQSVYDGDTLTLHNGDKVRLSWVNTPELRPKEDFGYEARDLTRALTLGKTVDLVLQGENPRDAYGRLLAGIQVEGRNLSLELVEAGLAHVFVIPPEAFDMQPLLDAQERARAARKGIWGTEHYQGAAHVTSLHANAEGDDTKNVNGESFRMVNLQAEPLNVIGWTVSNAAGRSFVLPDLTIPPGHTVQIRSGHGDPQRDPAKQLVIHLGSDVPVWDDHADRLTVYDRYERIVDTRAHGH